MSAIGAYRWSMSEGMVRDTSGSDRASDCPGPKVPHVSMTTP